MEFRPPLLKEVLAAGCHLHWQPLSLIVVCFCRSQHVGLQRLRLQVTSGAALRRFGDKQNSCIEESQQRSLDQIVSCSLGLGKSVGWRGRAVRRRYNCDVRSHQSCRS